MPDERSMSDRRGWLGQARKNDFSFSSADPHQGTRVEILRKSLAGERNRLFADVLEHVAGSGQTQSVDFGCVMACDQQFLPVPQPARETEPTQLANDRFRVRPPAFFLPIVVELDEKRLGILVAVSREVAPPVISLPQDPGQAAAEISEVPER